MSGINRGMRLWTDRRALRMIIAGVTLLSRAPFTYAAKPEDLLPNPATDIDPVEASLNQNYNQVYRPQFHYTAIQGHIGDATGLVYYSGEYHLF